MADRNEGDISQSNPPTCGFFHRQAATPAGLWEVLSLGSEPRPLHPIESSSVRQIKGGHSFTPENRIKQSVRGIPCLTLTSSRRNFARALRPITCRCPKTN
ncbi:hypothetical protein BaRGS_00016197 [Batillaria attramentaria]|uniref:Uncharacterized protein n=1 Tax=Batillaria attramentaria TaxID=370345 RepID=A0ABD0KZT7_9CAEN